MARDDIPAKSAILQRDQETYAIMARLLGGMLDVPTARRIAEVAEKYGVKHLKVTGDQRLALIGIREENIDAVYADLGLKPVSGGALCQQYLKVCPGTAFCSRGQRDTLTLAQKVQERFFPYPNITSKVKIGISGCFNSCAEPAIKDIGLIGLPKGWLLMAGGSGGLEPRLAETLARDLSDDQVLEALDKILKYYRAASKAPVTRNARLGVIMQREGKEKLLKVSGLA
jgi:NAD(P)H-nitrite reductase large subunit